MKTRFCNCLSSPDDVCLSIQRFSHIGFTFDFNILLQRILTKLIILCFFDVQKAAFYLLFSKPVELQAYWKNKNLACKTLGENIHLFCFQFLNNTELHPSLVFLTYYQHPQIFENNTSWDLKLNSEVLLPKSHIVFPLISSHGTNSRSLSISPQPFIQQMIMPRCSRLEASVPLSEKIGQKMDYLFYF